MSTGSRDSSKSGGSGYPGSDASRRRTRVVGDRVGFGNPTFPAAGTRSSDLAWHAIARETDRTGALAVFIGAVLGEFLRRDRLFVLDDLPEPGPSSIGAGVTWRTGLIYDVDGELDEARAAYEAAGDLQCPVPGRFRPTFDPTRSCERRLRRLGVRNTVMSVARLFDELGRGRVPPVAVQTLGGFRVMLSGVPIAVDAWQSRKARTLLKILIARRGRPVHREVLMEILWPGADPSKSSNRLSVALSTLRGVLDPGRAHPGDHVVAADHSSVWLVPEHLAVDLEEFMDAADRGLEAHRRGDSDQASRLLEQADARYRGGFLEGDAYQEWAVGVREEARTTYVGVLRARSQNALAGGGPDAADRFFLRILELDPYDERAHLGLVAAMIASGRHGEARRLYGAYALRMEELDITAMPYPHGNRRP